MQVTITGHRVEIKASVRGYIEERLSSTLAKYSDRTVNAQTTLSRDGREYECHCSAHLATGKVAHAHGEGKSVNSAFDQALERLEKQVRRYARKLRDHHPHRGESPAGSGAPGEGRKA